MQDRIVLGVIIGTTSTDSFEILLKEEFDQQKLKMRFVELEVEGDVIVSKIVNISKKNRVYGSCDSGKIRNDPKGLCK